MENQTDYLVTRCYRSPDWETDRHAPSVAFLEAGPEAIRIVLRRDYGRLITALDEIRFTRKLGEEERFGEFRRFMPESLLTEAGLRALVFIAEPTAFTLIPKKLLTEGSERQILGWTAPVAESDRVLSETLGEETMILFSVPAVWWNWALQVFNQPEVYWTTGISGLFRAFSSGAPNREAFLAARVLNQSVLALGWRDNSLRFINRFGYQSENDLLYYLLLACRESGLSPENDPVLLCGNISPGSVGFEKISRYLGNLSFLKDESPEGPFTAEGGPESSTFFDLICTVRNFPVSAP
jgi:hypothetical protein